MADTTTTGLHRANIEGVQLEFEVQGQGEPVLFVHGAIVAQAFAPLVHQPALLQGYRLVSYHRRGFAGSSRVEGPVSIARQAADARAMLDALGIERAHVVGHSLGAVIALQLALDAPQRVHTMTLLEPGTLRATEAIEFRRQASPVFDLYEAGEKAAAIEGFCQAVAGPNFREALNRVLPPDWFEQAVEDADTFFRFEMPSLMQWDLTPAQAGCITQPVLSVLGALSPGVDPTAKHTHEQLQAWLPNTEAFVLPGATHALQLMNPEGMAEGLAAFLRRHPMSVTA